LDNASFLVVLITVILKFFLFGLMKILYVLGFKTRLEEMTFCVCLSAVPVNANTGVPSLHKDRNVEISP